MKYNKIFIILLLLSFCVSVNAQKYKERQQEEDGFVWYRVWNDNDRSAYGAQDENGKTLIPLKYDLVGYLTMDGGYFIVRKNNKDGVYTKEGRCICDAIYDKAYYFKDSIGTYVGFVDNGKRGALDEYGRIIVPPSSQYKSLFFSCGTFVYNDENGKFVGLDIDMTGRKFKKVAGKKYYFVSNSSGQWGLTDAQGHTIIPCEMEAVEYAGGNYFRYKLNGFWGVINLAGKIIIDTNRGYTSVGNFISFTKRFPYTMVGYKGECDANGLQLSRIKVATPQQPVASNPSPSNSNGSSGSSTIIVQHQRQPQPMQVWIQCTNCWGSGTCPRCAGSGTVYVGMSDKLHLCSACGGRGVCSICAGKGGHYEVQYK